MRLWAVCVRLSTSQNCASLFGRTLSAYLLDCLSGMRFCLGLLVSLSLWSLGGLGSWPTLATQQLYASLFGRFPSVHLFDCLCPPSLSDGQGPRSVARFAKARKLLASPSCRPWHLPGELAAVRFVSNFPTEAMKLDVCSSKMFCVH